MPMPILWRYLLKNYFRVLLLAATGFIALLLTLRLTEIAHFAALGASWVNVLQFAFWQIPYILPIALPIAASISAILLLQHLSKNGELTALRSAGLSFREIFTPLLIAAAFMSLLNFYVVSELATGSHLSSALVKSELRALNPLLVMGNKYLMRLKNIYSDTLGPSKVGENASDVILAMPSKGAGDLNLLVAKRFESTQSSFNGQHVTILSTLQRDKKALFIENLSSVETAIKDFRLLVEKKTCTLNNDHLKMAYLLSRYGTEKQNLNTLIAENRPSNEIKQKQRSLNRVYSEMMRRVSIAIAFFSLTFLGAACGVRIGRNDSIKGIVIVIALTALYIAAYFSAKGLDHLLIPTIAFYILPHFLMLGTAIYLLRRASRGLA